MTAYRRFRCSLSKGDKRRCSFDLFAGKYGEARIIKGDCTVHGGQFFVTLALVAITPRRQLTAGKTKATRQPSPRKAVLRAPQ